MPDPNKKNEWWNQTVPSILPKTYLSLAAERGFAPEYFLDQININHKLLDDPQSELSMRVFEQLITAILDKLGQDAIGLEVGWRLPPTAFGNVGYALLCCATVGEAIQICQRFWHLIARGIHLSVETRDDTCIIDISAQEPVPDTFHRIMLECALTSMHRGFQLLIGHQQYAEEIWFALPEPSYSNIVRERLGTVKFDMPASQMRIPAALLETPLGMSNPTGLAFAIEQCEREEVISGITGNNVTLRVEEKMELGLNGYPDLEQIAQKLHMTTRTLRRKLQLENSGYKTLLERARRRDAIQLLENQELEIQKVAELLGYADPANFTRAFRQWTGQSPSQYRKARQNG